LYDPDALLDELEEEATPDPDEDLDLEDKPRGPLDIDEELSDDDDVVAEDVEADSESDGKEDDLLPVDSESWSDDPVRMYLTQMGEIPLLTRQQEISLAKQIEVTRAKFRRKVLECDYVMQQAVRVLRRVHDGDLPFDRTVQVSVTDRLEKQQILGRLPYNLRTLEVLLKRNRRDYWVATSRSRPMSQRREAWRRLGRCRRRAVRLVEEKGAVIIGADTSGLECVGACWKPGQFYPAHMYLLIEQGVYIAEFHYLEDLAKDKVYEFLYSASTNKIRGATAGFTMRPAAIR